MKMNLEQPQPLPQPQPELRPKMEVPSFTPDTSALTPEQQIEQKKIKNDPTRNFLRDQGFEGDPKIKYSLDVVTARREDGVNLMGQKTFTNYEDLQNFIKENPDLIAKKNLAKEIGVVPYKIDYDESVYEWSGKLDSEQSKKLIEAFDEFANETMDLKNFDMNPAEKTPDETRAEITQTENQTLSLLGNPELAQTVGEQTEISQVIRRMSADARQFENPDKKILADMAEEDLKRLNKYLKNGTLEYLLKADQLLSSYVNRSISHKLYDILNRADIFIPWEEKQKMLNVAILSERIRGRQDGMRTRDIIAQERNLDALLDKYRSKLKEKVEQVEEKEKNKFKAVVPRGWTTLKHGTNLLNWGDINPYTSDRIKIEKPLSVISQEDYERDRQLGGQYDTTRGYASMARRPEGISDAEFEKKNKPFEIRVLFYQDHARHVTDPEYKQGLDKKTMDKIAKFYFANTQGGRHPLVPRGETLVKLGQVQEDGKDVFYYVPESLADAYSKESGVVIGQPEKEVVKERTKGPF